MMISFPYNFFLLIRDYCITGEWFMNLKEFLELFLKFENDCDMFRVRVNHVNIWHYIRLPIYEELIKVFGLCDAGVKAVPKKATYPMTLERYWREKVTCNQFFAQKRDVLIFSHPRKYKDDGKYYKCIYTHLLDKSLDNSHYVLDRRNMENNFMLQRSSNILYCDMGNYLKMKRIKFSHESVLRSDVDNKIIAPIQNYFHIDINWRLGKVWLEMINSYLNQRKNWISYYSYMLGKINPKIILLVVSYDYDKMFLCEVASKRNIPVVELQHGAMGCSALQYNFYKKMNLPSFPDYIFTFGQFEKETTRFPLSKDRIIPVGFPELEDSYHKYKKRKNCKKTVVFISQGFKEIAEYANIVAKKLDKHKYHIIFQLHPKEYDNWESTLGKYLCHSNIEVTGSFGNTIHETLARADWVIGNYSTVLYEAQMFDTKVVILKFGLYQIVEYLYANKYALLVDSPEQLVKEIEEDTFKPDKSITIFEKNSLEKMQKEIIKIIRQNQR